MNNIIQDFRNSIKQDQFTLNLVDFLIKGGNIHEFKNEREVEWDEI